MNAYRRSRPGAANGFTLIELMVAVSIFGILLALAAPGYQTWIANTKVRTTAESIQNGLMLAKAEAVRRNTKVQFALTTTNPTPASVNSIADSASGTNWVVRLYQSGGTYTSADFIQGRSSAEGGTNTTVNAGQSNLVFTGIGRLSPIPAGAININVSGPGATRPLRITITPGGAIRMCDPALSIANTTMGCEVLNV